MTETTIQINRDAFEKLRALVAACEAKRAEWFAAVRLMEALVTGTDAAAFNLAIADAQRLQSQYEAALVDAYFAARSLVEFGEATF